MKASPLLVLLSAFALSSPGLRADVVFRHETAGITQPWSQIRAGAALAASTLPAGTAYQDAPFLEIEGSDYFAQSILGNGQRLKALAFYGAGLSSMPLAYSISVLDYGPVNEPIDTSAEFNPRTPPAVVAISSFVLGATSPGRLIFEFKGDDSTVLAADHAYVVLITTEGAGKLRIHRMPTGDSYEDGACARGLNLNPSGFNPTGATRDAVFALYTTTP
jgi:hypothetical protein